MRVGLVLMLFVLSMFAGRLVQLQGLDASALATAALDQRQVKVELLAKRGDITDSSGAVLATTVDRRDVFVDQTLVGGYQRRTDGRLVDAGLTGAAEDLAPLLGTSVEATTAKLTGTGRGAVLARNVTPDTARKVMRLAVPGVDTRQASRRIYPAGSIAANVLGFVSTVEDKAYGGVEGGFDNLLSGSSGLNHLRAGQGRHPDPHRCEPRGGAPRRRECPADDRP